MFPFSLALLNLTICSWSKARKSLTCHESRKSCVKIKVSPKRELYTCYPINQHGSHQLTLSDTAGYFVFRCFLKTNFSCTHPMKRCSENLHLQKNDRLKMKTTNALRWLLWSNSSCPPEQSQLLCIVLNRQGRMNRPSIDRDSQHTS